MSGYFLKRFLLIFPTLFVIILINFLIIQIAPGGPIDKIIAKINSPTHLVSEVSNLDISPNNISNIENSYSGIDAEIIEKIKKDYGFDKSTAERFWLMIKKFITFDFGVSFYQDKKVIDLIAEKMPTSISLGFFSTLIIYLISIPLGIKKAVKAGSKFDLTTTSLIVIGYSIPSFLIAIIFIIFFAGGNFLNIFPLRGLVSDNFDEMNFLQKIFDYLHHLVLPILSIIISGFATLTLFVKNSFIDEINKGYVLTAYAKGLNSRQVLYRHIFRNAMMLVISSIPAALIGVLFTSSMLIEVIFSLDGLGLMGYEAVISRDYPVMFATLYIFTLIGLITSIISDFIYKMVDPRIDFEKKI
jgi:microcin C transport system permease protein